MGADALVVQGTRCLAAIAATLLQAGHAARLGEDPVGWAEWAATLAVMGVVVGLVDGRRWQPAIRTRHAFVLACGAAPLLLEPLLRHIADGGRPAEAAMAGALRNVMLAVAALGPLANGLQAASLASLFLVLVGFLWSMSLFTGCLLALYALVGMAWLTGVSWERLRGRFVAQSQQRLPWGPVGLAIASVTVMASVGVFATPWAPTGWQRRGFFPSSGGSERSDPRAAGGVGDGDQLVAAQDDARSFGPLESELFLESQMPSLYDAINEFSDAPPRPRNVRQPLAIPLAPSQARDDHSRRSLTQQANREFSAVRRRSRQAAPSRDLRTHALMYVTGKPPLHLGLEAFDGWDGRALRDSGAAAAPPWRLDPPAAGARRWLRPSSQSSADAVDEDYRKVRLINLKTARIPVPPRCTGVSLDQLHSERLFRAASDGMLSLERDSIPQLTVLHLASRRPPGSKRDWLEPVQTSAPPELEPRVVDLARGWTAERAAGWDQVEAVCDRLRRDYVHDREALAPENCRAPLERFLFIDRRGPDYLFAASCAVMLRGLGYETRVVSGCYARPENFDAKSGNTAVYRDDVHFWVEIRVQALGSLDPTQAAWEPLEPTPGYEPPDPPPSLATRLRALARRAAEGLRRRPLLALLAGCLVCGVWRQRVELADLAVTLRWRVGRRFRDVRGEVVATVDLLERRAAIRRVRRPAGLPFSRWPLFPDDALEWRRCEREFRCVALWALYGERASPPFAEGRTRRLCRRVTGRALRPPRRRWGGRQP